MDARALDDEALSKIVLCERYRVPASRAAEALFGQLPDAQPFAAARVGAMTTACLVAALESACIAALAAELDGELATVVGTGVECLHHAPVAEGAELAISGFVERIDGHELTFRVVASDELEPAGEASIHVAVVARERMARSLARKRTAVARRAVFAGA